VEDNKRLILETTVSDTVAIRIDTNNPQTIHTSTPAAVENTAALDVSTDVGGITFDIVDSASDDGSVLIIPSSVSFVYDQLVSASFDTRLASSPWLPTDLPVQNNRAFEMTANLRNIDSYITTVDLFGRQQPGTHYLLKEGGNGYLTYENGNRILIL
jgi:hypothetical protein